MSKATIEKLTLVNKQLEKAQKQITELMAKNQQLQQQAQPMQQKITALEGEINRTKVAGFDAIEVTTHTIKALKDQVVKGNGHIQQCEQIMVQVAQACSLGTNDTIFQPNYLSSQVAQAIAKAGENG